MTLSRYRRNIANGDLTLDGTSLPTASNMLKVEWDDELARIAERWASQCPTELETLRTVIYSDDNQAEVSLKSYQSSFDLLLHLSFQYSQNIVEFKFAVEVDPYINQIEGVVNTWYNSLDSLKAEGDTRTLDEIFGSYTVPSNVKSAYFTQLAWAMTSKVGKEILLFKSVQSPLQSFLLQVVAGPSTSLTKETIPWSQ